MHTLKDIRKLNYLYWGGIIVILPLFIAFWSKNQFISWQYFRDPKDMLFLAVTVLSFLLFGIKSRTPSKLLWVMIPMGVLSVSSLFTANVWEYPNAWFVQFIYFNAGILLFYHVVHNLRSWEPLQKFLIASCLICSIWIILNWFNINPWLWFFPWKYKLTLIANPRFALDPLAAPHMYKWVDASKNVVINGPFNQPTITGAFIAITAPFMFHKKWVYFLVIPLFAIFILKSVMTWAAILAAGYIYYLTKSDQKKEVLSIGGWLGLILGIIIYLFHEQNFFDDQSRFKVWGAVLKWLHGKSILFGEGLGYFSDNFDKYLTLNPPWQHAHNEYLELYVSHGLLGLLMLCFLFYPIFASKRKDPVLYASFAALAVNSFGNLGMHISSIALVGIIVYGLIINDWIRRA